MKKLQKLIEYLLYLFVFLLPWQTRWMWHEGKLNGGFWEYGTFSLYGTDILFGLILILFLFWKIKKDQTTINKGLLLAVSCLLLIAFLSIFWSQDKGLASYASVKLLEGVLLFWIVSTIKFSFTKLSIAFVSSAVVQAGLGIWQFLHQSTFTSKWLGLALQQPGAGGVSVIENIAGRWLRAYGSLPHPNILAGWLVIGLFMLLGLAYRFAVQKKSFWKAGPPNFWLNIFIYWSGVVITAGLFFTFSREAWLALIVGSIFFWIMVLINPAPYSQQSFKSNSYLHKTLTQSQQNCVAFLRCRVKKQAAIFYKLLATGLVTIIVLSIIFWPLLSTRLLGQDRLEVKSHQERSTYLEQSWQIIKKHPLLGVGVGNYTLAVQDEVNPNLKAWDYQPVHNVYLLVLAELGVIGFIVFLWLIWSVIKKLRVMNNQAVWSLVCSSVVFVVLIIGFFDHYFWTLHFGIMVFWLTLGLSVRASSE